MTTNVLANRRERSVRNVGYLAPFFDFQHMTPDEIRAASIERARRAGWREFGEVTFVVHELSYKPAAFGGSPPQFRSEVLIATVEVLA